MNRYDFWSLVLIAIALLAVVLVGVFVFEFAQSILTP